MLDIRRKFDIFYSIKDHEWVLRSLLDYKVVVGTFSHPPTTKTNDPYLCGSFEKQGEKACFVGCVVDQKNFDDLCEFLRVALKVRVVITF